jgi:NAD(P)-dependent dehydrogenase (short-subunit alcohol dehydrogenase family)
VRLPAQARAVVTGAGSGLGRELAVQLGRRGSRLIIADVNGDRAEETVALVKAAGGSASAFACDVTRAEQLEAVAVEAERLYGGTDLLVNNAGVAGAGLVGEMPIKDWEWMLQVNLFGAIHGCHAFLPRMKAQGHGWILNVSSCAAFAVLPEMAAYNVSKAAVVALTETLYAELATTRLCVTALCPTFFKTNLMESFRSPSDRQRKLAEGMFKASTMTVEQVAAIGLRDLERGTLISLPQYDASFVWRVKRWIPWLYHRVLRWGHRRDLAMKRFAP